MGLTRRFVYLLSLGVIFLIGAIFVFNSIFVFIIYNLLCGLLLIIDYFISPRGIPVSIEFCGQEKLSLHETETISFQLYNEQPHELEIELKDEVPSYHFEVEQKLMSGTIKPAETEVFKYSVVPTKRGIFTFENLYIRFSGRLKLCTKSFKKELKREFKVYPSLKNINKYRLMMLNNQRYKKGRRNIRQRGRGTSFASLREYVSGDDYKKINWKATARLNEPIINQYQSEKNQRVYIFIDTGRPMSYTIKGCRKLDLVVNTAVVLADIINQEGDQSGVLLFNTEVKNVIMPGKGAEHRNKIMEILYKIDTTRDTSNYREAFQQFRKKERHRSIIFLFTDFETEEEARNILKVLPHISKTNIVIILLIQNDRLEKIVQKKPSNHEELFNKGVALELLNEREKIIKLLNRKGVFCIESPAEKLDYTAINNYIKVKDEKYF